jgi:L-arabinose isomerase
VVGHYEEAKVQQRLAAWLRAASAWAEWQQLKVARFGDNMRQVAVTEGDKVAAQRQLGMAVNGYGVGDLVARIRDVSNADIDRLVAEYEQRYSLAESLRPGGARRESLRYAARTELGLRGFLVDGSFAAFTDTFEDLHGLEQLPGLAVQRLMADGYGFGAEGDWKHAALVRALKVMASGLQGGTSFMEDYTYHLDPGQNLVLGAHMLEICPSIAAARPTCEIHPLGIGGKADPVRLVFDAQAGPAVNVSLVDLGHRFRLVANQVQVVPPQQPLPRLPVARALWAPQPDLETAAAAWIYAGGAHHTAFSLALTREHLEDFAEIAGLELLWIDAQTRLAEFKKELRWNEAVY